MVIVSYIRFGDYAYKQIRTRIFKPTKQRHDNGTDCDYENKEWLKNVSTNYYASSAASKLEERAQERFDQEQAEYEAKLAKREAKAIDIIFNTALVLAGAVVFSGISNGEDPAAIKKDSKRAEKADVRGTFKAIAKGTDPSKERATEKRQRIAAPRGTFKAIAEEWYAHKAKSWASETARKARESLDDDLFPKLGTKPIAEVTSADIKPVILLVHGRAPRLAVKARQYCNQIIEYAIQEGLREDGRLLSLRGALATFTHSEMALTGLRCKWKSALAVKATIWLISIMSATT